MRKIALAFVLVIVLGAGLGAAQARQAQTSSAPPVIAGELFNRASDALDAQNYDQAVRDLSLFILLNPTYSPAYFARAQGYLGLSDPDHALKDVDYAITTVTGQESDDYGAALYVMRAGIDRQQQRLADALQDYTRSIAIKPTMQAYASRGLVYAAQRDTASALSDLDSAISLDTTNPVLFIYRGAINLDAQDTQAAGGDFLNFFNLIQPTPTAHAALQSGQAITLSVAQGVVFRVPFEAKKGQYASALAAVRSGDVDPLLVLLDPRGQALAGDDDSGGGSNALILNYVIPADGEYALAVGHSLGGFTGTVLLQLQVSDEPAQ